MAESIKKNLESDRDTVENPLEDQTNTAGEADYWLSGEAGERLATVAERASSIGNTATVAIGMEADLPQPADSESDATDAEGDKLEEVRVVDGYAYSKEGEVKALTTHEPKDPTTSGAYDPVDGTFDY